MRRWRSSRAQWGETAHNHPILGGQWGIFADLDAIALVEQALGWTVDIVKHPRRPRGVWARDDEVIDWAAILPPPGFRGVLPRRWVVERTFAWLGQNRRFSKDFERLSTTGEALIYVAMTRLMVRRLART